MGDLLARFREQIGGGGRPSLTVAEDVPQDPVPGAKRARRPVATRTATRATMRKEINDELQAYGALVIMPAMLRDPICGQAAMDQLPALSGAIADIICRNPRVAEKFLAAGVLGDWGRLFMAAWPLWQTIYAHHVAHTIGQDEEVPNGPSLSSYTIPRTRSTAVA